jgi:hypothetical protein
MNLKSLLLVPAALVLLAPRPAQAYVGFRVGVGVPLFFPWYGFYAPAPVEYTRTVVYSAPPHAVGEQISPPPGPGFVWIAAHWSNIGQRWVWVGGRWEMPPSPSALWAPGHWVQGNAGWVWVDGAWTVGNGGSSAQPPGPPPTPPGAATPAPAAAEPVAQPSSPAPEVPAMAEGTVVADPPPAPISEFIPASPDPDFVWVGGYWGWSGGWYWTSGRYVRRPFHGAAWVAGGWALGPHGWGWHGGRWH